MKTNKKVTKLIVPLAGLGTRFAPSSTAYPKELTHLVDRPVLQYIIEEAVGSGITEVIFILNSSKKSIRNYFSQKFQDDYIKKSFSKKEHATEDLLKLHDLLKKVNFRYIIKPSTLGDGHSILFAQKFIDKDETFVVSMGDLLGLAKQPFIYQLIDIYSKENVPVISVEKVELEKVTRFGVVRVAQSKGRLHYVNDIVEKPEPKNAPSRLIVTGKYVLTPQFFDILKDLVKNHKTGEVKLADALKIYSQKNKLLAYECIGQVQDTGNKLDFIKATINFGLQNPKYKRPLKKFIKSIKL
jgi:UTP--glucose-1-phosphate uridylyltransferase